MEEENLTGFDPMTGNRIEMETTVGQPNKGGLDNQKRIQQAEELMTPDDFEYFRKMIEKKEGETDELFDLHGKALHTTNSFYFEKIMQASRLRTEGGKDGLYQTPGASFTDGDFEKAAVFQTLIDDQNTRGHDKRLDTQKYFDKVDEFIKYFWNNDAAAVKEYLGRISGQKINTFEEAVAAAEIFKYQAAPKEIKDNPDELAKLFGITVVFDKKKLPELTAEGTEGLQKKFELRSFRPEGVPLSEASTIFVPEVQVATIKQKLEGQGLTHIDVRPSEELETIRLINILDNQDK